MNKYILLLIVPFLLGADYLCYDENGKITQKIYSTGASYSSRKDCFKVDRETLQSVDKYKKVVDKKIVEWTQEEKDAEQKSKDDSQQEQEDFINSFKTKLKGINWTDEEINYILNSNF